MSPPIRFGTDGVRGPVGTWPITPAGAEAVGLGIATWVSGGTVFIGRDTRESGPDLVEAMIRGLTKGGSTAIRLGVLPTAAVSAAVAADEAAVAGVMITASHNPWEDNGIKVLDAAGEKLMDPEPLLACLAAPVAQGSGEALDHPAPLSAWTSSLPQVDLSGRSILLDAAHGAGSVAALDALEAAGARVRAVGVSPTGRNINDGVGTMCPPTDLQGCDFAICLDGDADRLVMVDPDHGVLDGDDLLWMLAQTAEGPVVGTVMSNGGLEKALAGRLVRTDVGDAKVHAEMVRIGAQLGGEPSGHIMLQGGMPTSDGLYTALRVLEAAGDGPLPIAGWNRWPQAKRNVRGVVLDPNLGAIQSAQGAGHRVLVRASGTEPVVRVMVEGPEAEMWAEQIAKALPPLA